MPKAQSEEEIALVKKLRKQFGRDLIQAYQVALSKGYTRSYGCFKRTAQKEPIAEKKKTVRKNKPYQAAEYPGQKVQMDVKYVPKHCSVDGKQYYVYIARDEYSRWTYREMYAERTTDSSKRFLESLVKHAPFKIHEIQTDNGSEFTKQLLTNNKDDLTLFELKLIELHIRYHRIRPATPRHNGKVERANRTDELRFYSKLRMFSLEDGRKQLKAYQRRSNNIIMTCLDMRSPNEMLARFSSNG